MCQKLACALGLIFYLTSSSVATSGTTVWVDTGHSGTKPALYLLLGNEVFRTWPIAAPRHVFTCVLQQRQVEGRVVAIDWNAAWRPTVKTKRAKALKGVHLKEVYGPNDPKNALGHRKISVQWSACTSALKEVRIHGTIEPQLVVQQARVSRGCVRMRNQDWDELANIVTPGTRVVFSLRPPP